MAITLTTAQRELLAAGAVHIRTLIDFHLDSGRYSFWDGEFDMAFEGQTYVSASDFGEVSAISLGQDLGAEGVEIKVNGTKLQEASPDPLDPGALFGTIETENYQLRRVDIRFAFFDPETLELVLLVRRYAGFIDQVRQVEEVGDAGQITSWLIFNLESIARRYSVRGARTRSHDDQQEIWAGDTFFKFTASTIEKANTLYWGREPPKNRVGATVSDRGGIPNSIAVNQV